MHPQDRLIKHLTNHKGYTARAKDWRIVYTESYETKSDAIKREKRLKGLKSKSAIANLISNSDESHSVR